MQILSSLSGLQFSAASAGYAPTNSGDVSAIASAYQVVSATATQLYAGTAYVTSVNDAPLSATRAGNAANAVQATSAWYDGTGRLISALPDEATVSSIASAYAESAASSKQDSLTFGYDAEDKISSIDGSALAGGGGGGIDSATCSAIASAYAESAVSSVSGNYLTAQAQASWSESASSSPSYIVDKPDLVDIVAGPGIVVDNPDGNTLRVSMASDYETLLYSHSSVENANTGYVYVLSEPVTNFERIRVEYWNREFQFVRCNYDFTITDSDTSTQFIASLDNSRGTDNKQIMNLALVYNSSGNLVDDNHGLYFGNGSSFTSASNRGLGVHKVYGINRTASN